MQLFIQDSTGKYFPASNEVVVAAAIRLSAAQLKRGALLMSPKSAANWLMLTIGRLEYEVFFVILLNNRQRVIAYEQLFRGTVDQASIYPREVLKFALSYNATAVVVAHNHPSNETDPSQADQVITRQLQEALALIDVRLLDHLIIGRDEVTSFAEQALL